MVPRRRTALATAVALAAAPIVESSSAGDAWGFWAGDAAGHGNAVTATMNPPADVTATADGTTVAVDWTAASVSTGAPVQGYVVTRLRVSDGATAAACGTSDSDPATTVSCTDASVPDGTYRYRVTAVYESWTADSAASSDVTVGGDQVPPHVAVTSIVPPANADGYHRTSPVTVTLTATDDRSGVASITYWIDNGTRTTVPLSAAAVVVAGDGNHVASFFATDAAGNVSVTGAQAVSIDTTAPTVTVDQAADQPDPTAAAPITYTVTFSEPVTGLDSIDVVIGGTAGATLATVTGSGATYTVEVSGMLRDGTVTAQVGAGAAVDAAGNPSSASTSSDNTVTLDTVVPTAPPAPMLASASDSGTSGDGITNDPTPTFTGTAEAGTVVRLYDGADEIGSAVATDGTYTITVTGLPEGTHQVRARATDAAGHRSTAGPATTVTIDRTGPLVSITSLTATGRRLDLQGAGGHQPGDDITVTVMICAGTGPAGQTPPTFPCANPADIIQRGVPADGTWTASSRLEADTNYFAQAEQTDAAGNLVVSNIAGPVRTAG
jgi:hypothetical protein